ncbi:MAG: cell division protein FtsZ [Thermomicrobiales bacterium]|nr:cell division protein FtsZ [Thermomicrobiales bacterium]MCO5217609.1 cell division protein FtsZ [Thermomicrobiales bacterium]MCO5224085.1 cell division protein FtsZ [Thermomicrobiales bacterium]MCO5226920.1 cell division protein FtsZ [Thermomicrobiales bacterium]
MQSRGQSPARRPQQAPIAQQAVQSQQEAPKRESRWSSSEMFANSFARIKVIGVGGAGGNAINRMVNSGVEGIEFVAVNTDAQALMTSEASQVIRIGDKLTKGLGAGGRPEVGERAAEESNEDLAESMRDCDMVFITAGMGGGTGTGASPVVAHLAKQSGALTVAVVTKPFEFEGGRRRRAAEEGVAALRDVVDALITIPNQRLLEMVDAKTTVNEAFEIADDVLRQGIAGISDLITKPGVINLDFADVKTIMQDAGSALMAIGVGEGADRAVNAAREAIESPLLEMNIRGAKGVLYNISASSSLTLFETSEAAEVIRAAADPEAEIIYGTSVDESLGESMLITLIATGFDDRPDVYNNYGFGDYQPSNQSYSQPQQRPSTPPAGQTYQGSGQPDYPGEDWESESSIIRFLRER